MEAVLVSQRRTHALLELALGSALPARHVGIEMCDAGLERQALGVSQGCRLGAIARRRFGTVRFDVSGTVFVAGPVFVGGLDDRQIEFLGVHLGSSTRFR